MAEADSALDPDDKAPPTLAELVTLMPQKRPFLFIDEVLEVSDKHAVSRYTFRPDEYFYAGHFPGYPVTPGVILLEMMTQAAQPFIFNWAIPKYGRSGTKGIVCLFATAEVEFLAPVFPGTTVTIRSELTYFRLGVIRARAETYDPSGVIVARGAANGAVRRTDGTPIAGAGR